MKYLQILAVLNALQGLGWVQFARLCSIERVQSFVYLASSDKDSTDLFNVKLGARFGYLFNFNVKLGTRIGVLFIAQILVVNSNDKV